MPSAPLLRPLWSVAWCRRSTDQDANWLIRSLKTIGLKLRLGIRCSGFWSAFRSCWRGRCGRGAGGFAARRPAELNRGAPGFDPGHVLRFQITGSWGETSDMKTLAHRIDRTLEALRTTPGVEAAAITEMLPGIPDKYQIEFQIDGHASPDHPIVAESRPVSGGYFDTMRIPLLQGEQCREESNTSDVVVNRSFVNMYLNNSPAIGHQITGVTGNLTAIGRWIIGVAGEA